MVPIVKGEYSKVETYVYTRLLEEGFNKAAACGILANIEKESNFSPINIGIDGSKYGLCQWDSETKEQLKKYCKDNNLNYTTEKGQMSYLLDVLKSPEYLHVYDYLKGVPEDEEGAYDAAYYFCFHYIVPEDNESRSKLRGNSSKNTYWRAYGNPPPECTPADDKGSKIVAKAREYLEKPYVWGGSNPDTSFDCSGFVYYVYKEAIGLKWPRLNAYRQYFYQDTRTVKDEWKAGDLVFFTDTYETGRTPNIGHVGIATGEGDKFIHCDPTKGVIETFLAESEHYTNHYYGTKRLVLDSETTSDDPNYSPESSSTSVSTYQDLIFSGLMYSEKLDEYKSGFFALKDLVSNLVEVGTSIFKNFKDYGYLVDLTNGGEFRFIVPEYGEDVKANWDITTIVGRSADIISYSSTSSRSISVSLELIAGAGLYIGKGDRIDDMHKDIAFVKSLEYPDYSKAIAYPPPLVYLYLNEKTQIRGVVDSVSVKYKKPYDTKNRPMMAELSFTVVQVSENPPDYIDVRYSAANSY